MKLFREDLLLNSISIFIESDKKKKVNEKTYDQNILMLPTMAMPMQEQRYNFQAEIYLMILSK